MNLMPEKEPWPLNSIGLLGYFHRMIPSLNFPDKRKQQQYIILLKLSFASLLVGPGRLRPFSPPEHKPGKQQSIRPGTMVFSPTLDSVLTKVYRLH
jgi:hypothetical protein